MPATTSRSFQKKKTCCEMLSPILIIWALLSVLVAATCTFSFLQPFWLIHTEATPSFGMVSYCIMTAVDLYQEQEVCTFYGGYFNLNNLPSGAWQAACVLYGSGCILMCLGAFLAVCNTCMPRNYDHRMSAVTGYVQTVAVLIMIAGLVIYPLGLSSTFYRYYCGYSAKLYNPGNCAIGWSYMLAIMGTGLSLFCPFLSQFTDLRGRDIFL